MATPSMEFRMYLAIILTLFLFGKSRELLNNALNDLYAMMPPS